MNYQPWSILRNPRLPATLATLIACILSSMYSHAGAADPDQQWGPDTVAQEELKDGRDPSFKSVADRFPMLQQPREALGVPEGRDEFVLLHDGRISVSNVLTHIFPEHRALIYFMLGEDQQRLYQLGVAPDAKSLAEGYLPIVTTPYEYDGLQIEQTVFAWTKNMAPDPEARLWAYVELKVKNPTDEKKSVPVVCRIACGWPAVGVDAAQWTLDVPARGVGTLYVKIPYDGTQPKEPSPEVKPKWKHIRYTTMPFCGGFKGIETVEPSEYTQRYKEVAATWQKLCNRGMTISVPEQRVNNAYRALKGQTFLCVDKEGDAFLPHDGAGFYEEGIWGVCATVYCQMLDAYGYHEEAQRYLESIISTHVTPDGEFITRFGYVDHGALLIALEEHFRYTQDREFLERWAPTMIRTCRWIAQRRYKEKRRNHDKDSATYGMVPYRPSGDYPVPDYNIMGDATACVGMEVTARALRAIGRAEADPIAAEAAGYRADLNGVIDRSIVTHDGEKLLPILPVTQDWLKRANYGSYGYYSYFSSMLLESGFLPIDDPRVTILKESLENRGGLIAGVCANRPLLSSAPKTSHGFAYGYWLTCLRRGEARRAILSFYGTMALGVTRSTLGGVEHPTLAGGTPYTIPHLRTDSQLLRLLRAMLVREEGDALILAQATPRAWLEHGKQIRVKDAPTYFGPIGYQIDSKVDEGRINVRIDPPKRESPSSIVLCLRHPRRAAIREVRVNGQVSDQFTAEQVTLNALSKPINVEVSY